MDLISLEIVEETWQEVDGYSPERMASEGVRFGESQPFILALIRAYTGELGPEAAELGIYLAYNIFRMAEKVLGGYFPQVSDEVLGRALENNERWLEGLEGIDDRFIERKVKYSKDFRQPYVIKYIIEALHEEDEMEITDDDRGCLFIILKTLIDAFDAQEPSERDEYHSLGEIL